METKKVDKPIEQKKKLFNPGPVTLDSGLPRVKLDFNFGARVLLPDDGEYRVRFTDMDTGSILYDGIVRNNLITSNKKYYINFRVEIWKNGAQPFIHDLNLSGRNVLIVFPVGTLGDSLAWFPYAEEFRKKHGCELYVTVDKKYAAVFKAGYPEIHFVSARVRLPADFYATYCVGLLASQDNKQQQPADWRIVGLQKYCAYLLGLPPVEIRPRLLPSKKASSLCPKEPYVCIGTQATAQAKYWNNAIGWMETVAYLKELGYRVLCIDRERVSVNGIHGNVIPYGAEDFTGDRPIQELVDIISGGVLHWCV